MKVISKDSGVYGNGKDIIIVDEKYYMLSSSPAKVCVSKDLENWTEYALDGDKFTPLHMAYGNGKFVIVGNTVHGDENYPTYICYSNDGANWIYKTVDTGSSHPRNIDFVSFVNNRFVYGWTSTGYRIVDHSPLSWIHLYETTDFITIKRTDNEFPIANQFLKDMAYGNGKYVACGRNGIIYISTNLSSWTKIQSGISEYLYGIVFGKGQFVITGDRGTILTSFDGANWIKQNSQTTSLLIRARYANGMYIACGYNGAILQSIDGINWQDISNNHSGVIYGLCYNNVINRFVMTSNYYSSNHHIPIRYLDVTRNLTTSDDSSLFFFDKELNLLGIVDYFISLRWRRKYFEAGEFEIVLPVNDYMIQFISTDVIVMRNNYTEAGIIETIEFSDNGTNEEVTISGRFLSALLSRRIVKNKINFSGNTIEGMNTIVNAMTPLTTQWETETVTMSSPHIDFQVTYKNAYDYLCKLAEYSNIGFRVVPNVDSKVYMFEVWKGLDRTSEQSENEVYSFSDDNYNIEQGRLVISEKTKANYVLVGGTGEDSDRVLVTVDDGATGFDRYEIFSDQKSLSNKDLSDSAYREKLKSVGESKLSGGTFQLEVTALVQQDYKVKWNLGDIVNIKKEKWGVYTTYRIIEVEETIEDGKKTIYPTFGSPLSSAWDDE